MDWNSHLTAIQGSLISIEKVVGPFKKIKYKGGNEDKISKVIHVIQQYLSSKNFIKDNISNKAFSSELESIVLFLFLNTEFEKDSVLDIKDLSHLRNVTPCLSKCLFANIVIQLDLPLYYSKVLGKLPIQPNLEVLDEMIGCIKQSQPDNAVEHTYILINEFITVLCVLEDEDCKDTLLDIASEMLKNISAINADWLPNWKLKQIHHHLGITLMYLLRLLKKCPIQSTNVIKLIDNLIGVTITLMKSVTINVFCVWAEVIYAEQPLQIIIAGEAYRVIEQYRTFKPASELVQMLGSIAKKPKTLEQIIQEADIHTMISKINACNTDHKQWFIAFISNNPLQNTDAINCLTMWSNLCTKDDLSIILNFSAAYKEVEVKKVVLKCAEHLSIEDLTAVSVRYLFEKNTNNLDMGTINDQLRVLLNKLEITTETDLNFIKKIHIMLLQNPKQVLIALFEKCTFNAGIITCLMPTFKSIRNVVKTNDIAKAALLDVFQKVQPSFVNVNFYKELLNGLLSLTYFDECSLVCDILMPLLQSSADGDSDVLLCTIQIFDYLKEGGVKKIQDMVNQGRPIYILSTGAVSTTAFNLQFKLQDQIMPVLGVILNIMEQRRCQILGFSSINQEIVHHCVSILLKYKNGPDLDETKQSINTDFLENLQLNNVLNKFYVAILIHNLEYKVLKYVYPAYDQKTAGSLLQMVLPRCVEQEWVSILGELETKFDHETTYTLLTDALIIICQVTKTQIGNNNDQFTAGLKYCLQLYGIIIKDVFRKHHTNTEDDIFLTKTVCRLLLEIPDDIRQTDGVGLIQLLSAEALQTLREEKSFLFSLVYMKDFVVSQMLAKRMISE